MNQERRVRYAKIWLGLIICVLLSATVWSQGRGNAPLAGPAINQSDDPILKEFRWRSIGPASMAGRIDDIEAVESNHYIIYVGFATGGIWKTINNGTTWEPIFDTYPTVSVGDIAIFQANPNIIWVGTGEANNRQSSSYGAGIYKSTDAGKTFTFMGLKETQSIDRIVTDPNDPNVVYVAAVGHLFGPNKERGIYKTTDGGQNWTLAKFIDEDTGFTLCSFLSAPPHGLGIQRRRHGFRHLEDHRRRQDLDQTRRRASWPGAWPDRVSCVALESQHHLRADRSAKENGDRNAG